MAITKAPILLKRNAKEGGLGLALLLVGMVNPGCKESDTSTERP